jgi:hypothetical protein
LEHFLFSRTTDAHKQMETSDLPLVVPLKASVWSLFADDVAELDDLKQTNANAAAAAACNSKRPGTAGTTVSSLPAGAPDESQIGGTTTAAPSPQASPKGKAPAGKKGGKSAPPRRRLYRRALHKSRASCRTLSHHAMALPACPPQRP